MANTQIIRRRIKSIGKTQKITKAMELVAASKMRRSVAEMEKTAAFSKQYAELLQNIQVRMEDISNPLLSRRKEIKKIAIVVFASDRGLAGSFNLNLLREAHLLINELRKTERTAKAEIEIIAVGKKVRDYFQKTGMAKIAAEFFGIGDVVEWQEVIPIAQMVLDEFLLGHYDQVMMVYNQYLSSLKQKPVAIQLLPLKPEKLAKENQNASQVPYKVEPSPKELLDQLFPKMVEVKVFQATLESNASEHSTRMVAMKNATEAASDLIDDLQLTYNSVRQSSITAELAEITSGAAALE